MALDSYQRVPCEQIHVERERRQRREVKTEDLERSIAQIGVLNPVIVRREPDGRIVLVAGERRLTACRNLQLADIPVRYADELSPIEARIIELEENLKREDLHWRDQVEAVADIHGLFLQLDPDWTMTETGERISLSVGTISMYIRIKNELENTRVAEASTVREAYNIIARQDQRAAGEALQELLELPAATPVALPEPAAALPGPAQVGSQGQQPQALAPAQAPAAPAPPQWPFAPDNILHGSFLEWAPRYAGPKFNFLHVDFPYGVELFSGPQGRGAEPTEGYKDTRDTYLELVECLCQNFDRLMSVSCHMMFWLSADHRIVSETIARFAKALPSLDFYKFPMIWIKSDNAGISARVNRDPRHIYEACLLASRGKRELVRVKADAYSAPTDKRFHTSTKPEPMLRHFMEMLVDQNTTLLDPTAGSAAALRAADSLGASRVFGLEIDEKTCLIARQAFRNARLLRVASEGGSGAK